MVYNVDFDISAIAVSLLTIFYIFNKKGLHKRANLTFLAIVVSGLISAIADIFSSIVNANPNVNNFLVQDIWNYLYLMVHNLVPYLLVLYILQVIDKAGIMSGLQRMILLLPVLADYVLLAANPFKKWVFFYDYNGSYVHGRFFSFLYFGAIIYLLVSLFLLMYFHKQLPSRKMHPICFFILMSVTSVIIQMIFPHLLIELFFQSIGLLAILYSLENKDDIINPETHIFNRFSFTTEAEKALLENGNRLIIVKLPNIQYYNSTVGVIYMKSILRDIAKWLEQLDQNIPCFDIGSGHFALFLKDEKINSDYIVEQICFRFTKTWGRRRFRLRFPVQTCLVSIPKDVDNMEDLLYLTDLTFDGTRTCKLDASEAVNRFQRRTKIEQLIQNALQNNLFHVYYQPIWEKESGKIHSAEALIRLIDDEMGFISPEEFIPIAEENGSILEIGAFVFEEVCRFYQEHRLAELGIEYIEVNLSVVQCMNKSLANFFEDILSRYHLDANRINLEITESAATDSRNTLIETVKALTDKGFQFSLDDYGTGYSNFSYMYDLPFSIIKLDKSILWSALHPQTGKGEENAMVLLESNIRMMHRMHYKILAEGVETADQKILLENLGCDLFQGYFFAKPIPGDSFLDFVKVVNA